MCIQRSLWTYSLLSLISKIYHSFSCYFQSRAAIVASVTRLSQVLLKGLDDKLSYDRSSNIWWLFWLLLKGLGDQFPYKSSSNVKRLSGQFRKTLCFKLTMLCLLFGQILVKLEQLFNSTSGHTGGKWKNDFFHFSKIWRQILLESFFHGRAFQKTVRNVSSYCF